MFAIILAAVLTSSGTPATATDNLVTIDGRPGCTGLALNNDPARPVVVCVK